MRFDIPDLSLFRHVVEAGSITQGAARAHLALAAASTRIRNMEDAIGASLFNPFVNDEYDVQRSGPQ